VNLCREDDAVVFLGCDVVSTRRLIPTSLYGVTTQTNNIVIFTAVRTLNQEV
jgi:hypothetical protein